jgi:hypothetical protein
VARLSRRRDPGLSVGLSMLVGADNFTHKNLMGHFPGGRLPTLARGRTHR